MTGEPVETFIGVTALGIGTLVVYAAVKNVNPIALIKETVQSGTFADLSKLPKWIGPEHKGATDLNQTLPPGDPGLPSNAGKPPKCAPGFTPRWDTTIKKWSCIGDVPLPGGQPGGGTAITSDPNPGPPVIEA